MFMKFYTDELKLFGLFGLLSYPLKLSPREAIAYLATDHVKYTYVIYMHIEKKGVFYR